MRVRAVDTGLTPRLDIGRDAFHRVPHTHRGSGPGETGFHQFSCSRTDEEGGLSYSTCFRRPAGRSNLQFEHRAISDLDGFGFLPRSWKSQNCRRDAGSTLLRGRLCGTPRVRRDAGFAIRSLLRPMARPDTAPLSLVIPALFHHAHLCYGACD